MDLHFCWLHLWRVRGFALVVKVSDSRSELCILLAFRRAMRLVWEETIQLSAWILLCSFILFHHHKSNQPRPAPFMSSSLFRPFAAAATAVLYRHRKSRGLKLKCKVDSKCFLLCFSAKSSSEQKQRMKMMKWNACHATVARPIAIVFESSVREIRFNF